MFFPTGKNYSTDDLTAMAKKKDAEIQVLNADKQYVESQFQSIMSLFQNTIAELVQQTTKELHTKLKHERSKEYAGSVYYVKGTLVYEFGGGLLRLALRSDAEDQITHSFRPRRQDRIPPLNANQDLTIVWYETDGKSNNGKIIGTTEQMARNAIAWLIQSQDTEINDEV